MRRGRNVAQWSYWLIVFLLVSCNPVAGQSSGAATEPAFYQPPTYPDAVATIAPAASSTPLPIASPTPEAILPCVDNLLFLEDLTIPDGTAVKAGTLLDKRWLVENNGTCNWNASYRLVLIAGPELGATSIQALYPARSGAQAQIRIVFTAPEEPGTYRSAWQAYDPQGIPFGDPIFIDFMVEAEITPTP
jgi:hypothetical protein